MIVTNLIRWSGLAIFAGGVLLAILSAIELVSYGDLPMIEAMVTPVWVPVNILFLVGLALATLGLVGLYVRQAERAGALGLVAFLVTFVAMLLNFAFTWAGTFLLPWLAAQVPDTLATIDGNPPGLLAAGFIVAVILLDLGWLLFGLASLRAGVLPRGAAVLMMIGAVLDFVIGFLGVPVALSGIVLIAAAAWMGLALWSEKPVTVTAQTV